MIAKYLTVFSVVMLTCLTGGFAATLPVGNPPASIQAVIAAAPSGSVIELGTGTYVEDLYIKGANALGGAKINITIQPAAGNVTRIRNSNLGNGDGPGLAAFARGLIGIIQKNFLAGGPDHKGLIVEGNGCTLNDLTFLNELDVTGDPYLGSSSCICVLANNCTINNCVIQGAPPQGNDMVGTLTISGNWVKVNAALGGALTPTGYGTAIYPVTNLQHNNCTFQETDIAFAGVDYAHALLLLAGPAYINALATTVGFTNCEFKDNDDVGQTANASVTLNNCDQHDNLSAFTCEGGSASFTNCTFSHEIGNNDPAINGSADLSFGDGGVGIVVTDCVFCGGGARFYEEDDDAQASFFGCVFSSTATVATDRAIMYDCTDLTGDFNDIALTPSPFGDTRPASRPTFITLDNCDIYIPGAIGIDTSGGALTDDATHNRQPATLTVTDSIITADVGLNLASTGTEARTSSISNSNIFAGNQINNTGVWTSSSVNNINITPGYVSPGTCDPAGFLYASGTAQDTLGTGSTEIGSQGNTIPTPPAAGVADWSLYQ
jgi:hypothetical protein